MTLSPSCPLLLSCLLALSAASSHNHQHGWKTVHQTLDTVSVGRAGVWGVLPSSGTEKGVAQLEGTYRDPTHLGDTLSPLTDVHLVQVDVGSDVIWGVKASGEVYFRTGFESGRPTGCCWIRVDGRMKHVTVSPHGYVWGVNSEGNVSIRHGASNCDRAGDYWSSVPFHGRIKQVSAGYSGVWAVDEHDDVYHRTGTFGDSGLHGTAWEEVTGEKMTYIASGDGFVAGVTTHGECHVRDKITQDNPTGSSWDRRHGPRVKVIDTYRDMVVGIDYHDRIVYKTL